MRRLLTFIIFVPMLMVFPGMTFAAGIVVTDVKIGAGKLTVQGKSPAPNQTVELDGKFSVQSDGSGNFSFGVPYVPAGCVIEIRAGASSEKAAVANCAVGLPRGTNLIGAASLSGAPDDRGVQTTFAVSGTKAGASVIFSSQAATPNGVIFYGGISLDGHTELDVWNSTGESTTAISGLPVRIITIP